MNTVSTDYWIAYTREDENIINALGVAANLATGYSYLQTTCFVYPPVRDGCMRPRDVDGAVSMRRESLSTAT